VRLIPALVAALTLVSTVATADPAKMTDAQLDKVVAGADHLITAVTKGGLTLSSQPFLNGINNPGKGAREVTGAGSPNRGRLIGTPSTSR
jgi:hypothetical protein